MQDCPVLSFSVGFFYIEFFSVGVGVFGINKAGVTDPNTTVKAVGITQLMEAVAAFT